MNQKTTYSLTAIFLFFFTVLLGLHVSAPKVTAAQQQVTKVIKVSPVIIHLNLKPDHTTTYEVTVENLLSTPLPVRAIYNDFTTTGEDGGYTLTDHNSNSLLSWVSLDNKEWIIPAETKQKVTLTIKTPQKISLGGYYGLLFFQPVMPQGNNQTIITAQVGVLLLGDLGVGTASENPGEIVSFTLPFLSQKPTMPLLLRVKNTSLNFFTAKPILKVKPLFGETRTQFLEEKVIFPGKIRRWDEMIKLENIGIGIYQVTMQVSTGKGHILEKTQTLVVFPWVPVLLIIAGISCSLWLLMKRNNIKNALKALIYTDELK